MNALPLAEFIPRLNLHGQRTLGRHWRAGLANGLFMALVLGLGLGLTACTEKATPPDPAGTAPVSGAASEPSTQVLGVVPASPTRDSAASKTAAKSDMTQAQQSSEMPLPGQANDHSVLVPKPMQKPASR